MWLFVSVGLVGLYFAIRSFLDEPGDVSAKAIAKEGAKKILLQVQQVIAILSGIGIFANLGFLGDFNEILVYVVDNFDSTWDYVASLIVVVTGLFSFFRTNQPDKDETGVVKIKRI